MIGLHDSTKYNNNAIVGVLGVNQDLLHTY